MAAADKNGHINHYQADLFVLAAFFLQLPP
jgi:hypothetical protein